MTGSNIRLFLHEYITAVKETKSFWLTRVISFVLALYLGNLFVPNRALQGVEAVFILISLWFLAYILCLLFTIFMKGFK
jgi:hypothetical protein